MTETGFFSTLRRERKVATAEDIQRCLDNHQRWYEEAKAERDQARDDAIEVSARKLNLSESQIDAILGRQ